nr:CDP-diacylglycerol--serine O-phosphatidyltransferase [Desulfobacterales bacterium]
MKRKKRYARKRNHSRGIYILPNLFTSLSLFCGFYAIIAAIDGQYVKGAISIMIASLFDGLDGRIARATKTVSRFGLEYDSLSDLVSFGVAPGILVYLWALQPFGRLGWLASFLFLACGALRLARFNTQANMSGGEYFLGLPIPAAAFMIAALVLFFNRLGLIDIESERHSIILISMYVLSFLMVSTIRYGSFKKSEFFRKKSFNLTVAVILVFIVIAYEPSVVLFLLTFIYIVSGPLNTLRLRRKAQEIKKTNDLNQDLPEEIV